MKYETLTPISKNSAERVFAGSNADKIAAALMRLGRFCPDCEYAQAKCLQFIHSSDSEVRFGAVTGCLYLAMRGGLDTKLVYPAIQQYASDPDIEMTFDEIKRCMKRSRPAEAVQKRARPKRRRDRDERRPSTPLSSRV